MMVDFKEKRTIKKQTTKLQKLYNFPKRQYLRPNSRKTKTFNAQVHISHEFISLGYSR